MKKKVLYVITLFLMIILLISIFVFIYVKIQNQIEFIKIFDKKIEIKNNKEIYTLNVTSEQLKNEIKNVYLQDGNYRNIKYTIILKNGKTDNRLACISYVDSNNFKKYYVDLIDNCDAILKEQQLSKVEKKLSKINLYINLDKEYKIISPEQQKLEEIEKKLNELEQKLNK